MKSDRGLTHTAPRYTRVTYDGKSFVALGDWTPEQMVAEIEKIEARKPAE